MSRWPYTPWTEAEFLELIRRKRNGEFNADIAAAMGRGVSTIGGQWTRIRQRMDARGITPPIGGFGNGVRKNNGSMTAWSEAEVRTLCRMKRDGASNAEIVGVLGYSMHSVRAQWTKVRAAAQRLGHPLPPGKSRGRPPGIKETKQRAGAKWTEARVKQARTLIAEYGSAAAAERYGVCAEGLRIALVRAERRMQA